MDKNTLIENLKSSISSNQITKEEVLNLFDEKKSHENKNNKIVYALYIIGALIALVGVGFLVSQFWDEIGMFGRVFLTLGVGIVAYGVATFLRSIENRNLAQILYMVSVLFMPAGIFVFMSDMNYVFSTNKLIFIFSGITIIYLSAWFATKRNILILVSLFFSYVVYNLAVFNIIDKSVVVYDDLIKYSIMLLAICSGVVAYYMKDMLVLDRQDKKEKKIVSEIIYFVSTLGLLIPMITFDGVMDFVAILVMFALLYVSVHVVSGTMLIASAIIFVSHLSILLVDNFSDSLGFGIIMVLIGFLIIGVGYATLYVNKNYLKKSVQPENK